MSVDIKTIFLDIDGCLVFHNGNMSKQMQTVQDPLPGAVEKLNQWEMEGHRIILTTGRKESTRRATELMLDRLGIFYDQLIMGLPRGPRVVINDTKPNSDLITAVGICVPRNQGIKDVEL